VTSRDIACGLLVIVSPATLEAFNCPVLELLDKITTTRLAEEGINDDRDKQIKEDLTDDDLEEEVEGNGKAVAAALRPVSVVRVSSCCYDRVVVFAIHALVVNRVLTRRLEHD